MALVSNRSGVGGRKATIIPNHFVVDEAIDDDVVVENLLWNEEDTRDINIEDIIVGITRSFCAEEDDKVSELVDARKIVRIYSNVNEITRQSVQDYLRCSEKQAKRYIKVIKICNEFIITHLNTPKTAIGGYRNCSKSTFAHLCTL